MWGKNKNMDVRKIVKGCIDKSMASQRALYDYLFDNIVYSIRYYPLTKEEMEDLIQEIFIKIYTSISLFDSDKANIKTWSTIIASRSCIDFLKSKKPVSVELEACLEIEPICDTMDDFLATELIIAEIEYLPEKYREVFKLYTFSGADHNKIGKALDITASSSRVYLTRAKEMLQSRIQKIGIIPTTKITE